MVDVVLAYNNAEQSIKDKCQYEYFSIKAKLNVLLAAFRANADEYNLSN